MQSSRDFDAEQLERLRQLGGDRLILKLVGLFGQFTRDRVQDAVAASAGGDWPGVSRAAHAIRSSAGNVGASRLLAVATDIEHAAARGDATVIPARVADLQDAFDAAHAHLCSITLEAA